MTLNGTAIVHGRRRRQVRSQQFDSVGANEAGHFTARAMLEANFTTNDAMDAITGTLDDVHGCGR